MFKSCQLWSHKLGEIFVRDITCTLRSIPFLHPPNFNVSLSCLFRMTIKWAQFSNTHYPYKGPNIGGATKWVRGALVRWKNLTTDLFIFQFMSVVHCIVYKGGYRTGAPGAPPPRFEKFTGLFFVNFDYITLIYFDFSQ